MNVSSPTPNGWAMVTGGASGIGRAIANRLAGEGWHVGLLDCDLPAAEAARDEILAAGQSAEAHALDVASSEEWEMLVADLRSTWPRLDLVVNAAGDLAVGPLIEATPGQLARLVEVNLLGTLYGCRSTLPWLIDSAGGSPTPPGVINIASIFAHVSPPGFATYNATKAAIVSLTESLWGEMAAHGLRATVVLPGVTPTGLFARASYQGDAWREVCERYVAGAELTPEAVAMAALTGFARRRLHVVVGTKAKRYAWLKRLAPSWLIDTVARRAAQLSPRAASQPHRAASSVPTAKPT